MNNMPHLDEQTLAAYLQQPDAVESKAINLHLASCKQCRQQITLSNRLKTAFASIDQQASNEQQQQIVDDFLYGHLSTDEIDKVKQTIKNDPILLRSALFSLSHRQPDALKPGRSEKKQLETQDWLNQLKDWFQWQTSAWASVAITAVVTVSLTVFVLHNRNAELPMDQSVAIASYQDDNVIRFVPKDSMPGIGFFTGAQHYSRPFQGMQISYSDKQQLQLEWEPIDKASTYELDIYRFSQGEKQLHDNLSTDQTHASINLTADDYNQRYEWVLSGQTNDDKNFITTGGFIVHQHSTDR